MYFDNIKMHCIFVLHYLQVNISIGIAWPKNVWILYVNYTLKTWYIKAYQGNDLSGRWHTSAMYVYTCVHVIYR